MQRKAFPFELKAIDEKGTFSGWASTFGGPDLGNDVIAPNAFAQTLRQRGPERVLLWQHRTDQPVGKVKLREEGRGLWADGVLNPALSTFQDHYTMLKDGLVGQMSIGFDAIQKDYNDQGQRVLKEIALWEISLVTFGMNPEANIESVKSAAQTAEEETEVYRLLSELSDQLKHANQRDVERKRSRMSLYI